MSNKHVGKQVQWEIHECMDTRVTDLSLISIWLGGAYDLLRQSTSLQPFQLNRRYHLLRHYTNTSRNDHRSLYNLMP